MLTTKESAKKIEETEKLIENLQKLLRLNGTIAIKKLDKSGVD
jgi:sensor histidine kinase YesM